MSAVSSLLVWAGVVVLVTVVGSATALLSQRMAHRSACEGIAPSKLELRYRPLPRFSIEWHDTGGVSTHRCTSASMATNLDGILPSLLIQDAQTLFFHRSDNGQHPASRPARRGH